MNDDSDHILASISAVLGIGMAVILVAFLFYLLIVGGRNG